MTTTPQDEGARFIGTRGAGSSTGGGDRGIGAEFAGGADVIVAEAECGRGAEVKVVSQIPRTVSARGAMIGVVGVRA